MSQFDPNSVALSNGQYFALPFDLSSSAVVLIPIPWDVTTSYRPGTSAAPRRMIEASEQIDLYDETFKNIWEQGIYTDSSLIDDILESNKVFRPIASEIIEFLSEGEDLTQEFTEKLESVNEASEALNSVIYEQVSTYLKMGKSVGLVGGDHSIPFGGIKALSEKYSSFGILHFDAHADLRIAYEGFKYSHASIFSNVIEQIEQVSTLVQVGLRDYCEEELEFSALHNVTQFTDKYMQQHLFVGGTFDSLCNQIILSLPDVVYISFDIDVFEPSLCPSTGTPVPGGLTYGQFSYLIDKLSLSGKQFIGFDLCEVGNDPSSEWDANVGSRVLYKLSLLMLHSGASL